MTTRSASAVARFDAYAEYRSVGPGWFPEIPQYWGFTSFKYGYESVLGKMLQNDPASETDALVPYLRAANLQWDGVDVTDIKQMWLSPHERRHYELHSGDLLISEGGDVGRSAIWQGYIQNAVHRVRGREGNLEGYAYYWMYFLKHVGYIDLVCDKATIAHLTGEKLASLPLAIPPAPEQEAIVAFLDEQVRRVTHATDGLASLLALLEDYRQALITEAATKGLDPDVPIKDSGIEWLGEIPEHWDVRRFKYVADLIGGSTPAKDEPTFWNGDIPWFSPKDMKGDVLDDSKDHITASALDNSTLALVPRGTVLIVVRSGILRHSFPVASVTCEASVNQDMKALVPGQGADGVYLKWLLKGISTAILALCSKSGATVESIEVENLRNLQVPMPPVGEQIKIERELSGRSRVIDSLVEHVRALVARLLEYRTALITSAVTGQIDVREAV